jgi:hypothetical protein
MRRGGKAVDDRVDGAVTAGGYDNIEIAIRLARQTLNVADNRPSLSHHDGAAKPLQLGDNPGEPSTRSRAPRRRIGDDQYPPAHAKR